MNGRGLALDISLNVSRNGDRFESTMGATYRDEGLSVGNDHMRLYGQNIQFQVLYSDLKMGKRLGQGACSAVHLATHVENGDKYAVKVFNVFDDGQKRQLYNEMLLITRMECDALISLKGAYHDEGSIGMILEYMDRGSLEFILKHDVPMTEEVMAAITFQIIWGLGYLHYENQIHRDIKPANILMNSNGEVKLSDFGITRSLDSSVEMSKTSVGSFRYMSPERLQSDKYDAAADIWSVGITIMQLWTKHYPFEDVSDTPIDLISQLESRDMNEVLMNLPSSMREIVGSMLVFEPHKRVLTAELAGSDWFGSFGIDSLPFAQAIIAKWLKEVDKSKGSNNNSNNNNNNKVRAHNPFADNNPNDPFRMDISVEKKKPIDNNKKYFEDKHADDDRYSRK